ncbi:BTE_HP_G0226010.mRNA.1.CDS.1 [Saccharomyces cerevisiae]|nr:BTE_HP_G0226010.mRNA.1.CDS.1 [Saccharomyces cerevisiae]CAI6457753.1 BTE_HP_G0226010.mRNA.1.CDS.1 [Saccharomyces cerevisiae]
MVPIFGGTKFLTLFPSSKIRKLSTRDLKKVDVNQVQKLSKLRVLEILSGHDMIKEQCEYHCLIKWQFTHVK